MPTVALNGTDILHVRPDLKTVNCPYTMKSYVAVPAIDIDVAVIHTAKSDIHTLVEQVDFISGVGWQKEKERLDNKDRKTEIY